MIRKEQEFPLPPSLSHSLLLVFFSNALMIFLPWHSKAAPFQVILILTWPKGAMEGGAGIKYRQVRMGLWRSEHVLHVPTKDFVARMLVNWQLNSAHQYGWWHEPAKKRLHYELQLEQTKKTSNNHQFLSLSLPPSLPPSLSLSLSLSLFISLMLTRDCWPDQEGTEVAECREEEFHQGSLLA